MCLRGMGTLTGRSCRHLTGEQASFGQLQQLLGLLQAPELHAVF